MATPQAFYNLTSGHVIWRTRSGNMMCSFRYVEDFSDISVNMHLFTSTNGTPSGDVAGPSDRHLSDDQRYSGTHGAMPLPRAFAAAIRMANCNDIELVISGDRDLWDPRWGALRLQSLKSV